MIRYEVTGSYVALHHGRVELTKEQAAPRAYALKHLKGDTYELTAETQVRFSDALAADGLGPSTIRRRIGVIRAALACLT